MKGKKTIASFLLTAVLGFLVAAAPASAEWTAPDFGGNSFGAAMNQILVFIKEVIWAAAKKAAIQSIANEVNNNVSTGADGSPQFIMDWREALQTQPEDVTRLQVKNFFTKMGNGKNSNYVTTSGSASGSGSIISNAQDAVLDSSVPELINLAEYGVDDPSEIFNGDNFRAFMTAYGSSGKNVGNGVEATLIGYDIKAKYEEVNKQIAAVQAMAYGGYSPTISNGQVVAPGSTIRDIVSHAQGMSFQNLANAKSIGEVVGALVARTVSNAIHKGIGSSLSSAKKKVNTAVNTADQTVDSVNNTYQTYSGSTTAYGNINQ